MFCRCGCGEEVNTGKIFVHGHNGFNLTKEQEMRRRECISKAKKGKPCTENRKQKLIKYYEIPENRNKIRLKILDLYKENPDRFDNFATVHEMLRKGILQSGSKGKKWTNENSRKKISVASKTRWQNQDYAKKMVNNSRLYWGNPENIKKASIASKKNWENIEYVKKVRARKTPSGLEIKFIDLINENNWNLIYIGDFQLNIGRKFPDFWDGDKKLVELFGYYHNDEEEAQQKIEHYKKFGYDCLVVWASDLNKNQKDRTVKKVLDFLGEELHES
jgi:very-short-patch-repair endonuclease